MTDDKSVETLVKELEEHTAQSAFGELKSAFVFVNKRFSQIDGNAESIANFLKNDLGNLINLMVWNIAMVLAETASNKSIAVEASLNAEKALSVAEGTISAEMLAEAAEAVHEYREILVNSLSKDHPLVVALDEKFAFLLDEFEGSEGEDEGEPHYEGEEQPEQA